MGGVLYLAFTDGGRFDADDPGPWEELFPLRPELALIESGQSRSAVYHAVKDLVPRTAAVLVAPLADVPKFKRMDTGALNWVRARSRGQLAGTADGRRS